MYVLDTDVLSGVRKKARVVPVVAAWLKSVAATDLYLSAISILEIDIGSRLIARKDKRQGETLRR
jgi:predicted nucleic acid-binding protein